MILASASKARLSLIEKTGFFHKVIVSDIEEDNFDDHNIKSLVEKLSFAKAESVVSQLLNNKISPIQLGEIKAVIGCDSLFELNNEILGKPKSHEEAIDRLKRLSSSTGFLHTGHCLLYRKISNKKRAFEFEGIIKEVISTKVEFNEISYAEILNYIKSEEPMQSAGGFNLEGKGGMFIKKIEGCYTNVIGLSLPWLRDSLKHASLIDQI